MELVEDELDVSLATFLDAPRCCFLAQSSDEGPRVSPLWYLWEEETVWIVAQLPGRSYPQRVEQYPESALAVVDFDAVAGRVRHVGMRGTASLEPWDSERADRLLVGYLGEDREEWDETFQGLSAEEYRLLRFVPETVVARRTDYETGLDA